MGPTSPGKPAAGDKPRPQRPSTLSAVNSHVPFVPTRGTHPLPPKGDHPKSPFPAVSSNTCRLENVHLFPGSEHSALYSDRLIKGVAGDTAAVSPRNE